MLSKAGSLLASLCLFALIAIQPQLAQAGRGAPLYTPEPIPVGKLTPEQVRKTVRKSLLSRGWVPKDEGPGLVVGTLVKQRHKAVINVKFDARNVRITYRDSEALNYKKSGDKEVIHATYNKWVKNVETDIAFSLSQLN